MLETPTGGHVLFHGTDLTDKSVNINQIREKIGMVFQHFNLFPNMTIRENICLAPVKLKLMTKEEDFGSHRIINELPPVFQSITLQKITAAAWKWP